MAIGIVSDNREEFVKGRVIELPPPSPAHARLIDRLSTTLWEQFGDVRRTWAILTTAYALGVERGYNACRNPDLAVFRRDALKQAYVEGNNLFAEPLLIAECLSPRDRKGPLTDLLEDYHRMGAKEVWIIDPHARRVMRHLATDERPDLLTPISSPLRAIELPQVSVDINELWRAFDGEW